ncbi:hypothetical protein AAXE64_27920 [Priestia megaterium]|uniref:hypothetical protein n=1 Tax=Priestia megaterium TaxID=1404 RepID=UPI003CFCE46B
MNLNEFNDKESVRIKETGEIVTVDYWWQTNNRGPANAIYQYNIIEKPGTWYSEYELEKIKTE